MLLTHLMQDRGGKGNSWNSWNYWKDWKEEKAGAGCWSLASQSGEEGRLEGQVEGWQEW